MNGPKTAIAVFVGTLAALVVFGLLTMLYVDVQLGRLADALDRQLATTQDTPTPPDDYFPTQEP
jgi:hypothetical protein